MGANVEQLKYLFDRIGAELGIEANLLTCKDLANPAYYAWASTLKGVNWIHVGLDHVAENLKQYGEIQLSNVWGPIKTLDAALFFILAHEYTHLMGSPKSMIGLGDDDYFAALAPLGDMKTVAISYQEAPSDTLQKAQSDMHDEAFYTAMRINIYQCGRILEELEK